MTEHGNTADTWGEVRFDPEARLLALKSADGAVELDFTQLFEVNGKQLAVREADGMTGSVNLSPGQNAQIGFSFEEPALGGTISVSLSDDGETVLLDCEIQNHCDEAVALGHCCPLVVSGEAGSVKLHGDDGQAVYLQQSATTSPSKVYRAADKESPQTSNTLLQIVSHAAGRAVHFGFVTFDRMPTLHTLAYDEDAGFSELACICDLGGWELGAGEALRLETLMIEVRDDFHASLHNWAERVAAHCKPAIWPKIPAGWVGWAWVDAFNVEQCEDVVVRNAEAMRRRLPGFDIEYVWVSIGNIKDGMPGDWLSWDDVNFPRGHEWLTEKLGGLDFKLGLWSGCFWICGYLEELVAEMHDALLKMDGELAPAPSKWRYGAAGQMKKEDRPSLYTIDPTHPKTREFLTNVFATYREWGIRYYMLDFLYAVWGAMDFNEYHDRSVIKGPAMLRKGLEPITEAAGPGTYKLSSTGATIHCVNHVTAARIGNDYGEGRALSPDAFFYPATFVINSAGFWTSHRYASDNMAASYFTHCKLYVNDSGNVMTVDKPIPLSDAQITATIFGISGGPVMLGDDIDRIAEERLALIKKVFPRTPEIARPVDLFDSPNPDYPKVFHRHVDAEWGEWDIVAVLNYGDDMLKEDIGLQRLALAPDGQYLLWEFWNEQYVGTVTGELDAVVPPRSARLYRLAKRPEHPWVLATDMHVMQGQVELAEVSWDAETMTLSGTATRPAGEIGNIFIYAPAGLCVVNPQGHWIAKDAASECLIIRRQFHFGDEPEPWAIQFAPIG